MIKNKFSINIPTDIGTKIINLIFEVDYKFSNITIENGEINAGWSDSNFNYGFQCVGMKTYKLYPKFNWRNIVAWISSINPLFPIPYVPANKEIQLKLSKKEEEYYTEWFNNLAYNSQIKKSMFDMCTDNAKFLIKEIKNENNSKCS